MEMTAARSVLGAGRFVNGNKPALSGFGKGQVTRKKGGKKPAGIVPQNVGAKEKDYRPIRKKIEADRRPLNYGKDRPQYRPDQPDAPVVKKKPVVMKGVPKPTKIKGNARNYGASRS